MREHIRVVVGAVVGLMVHGLATAQPPPEGAPAIRRVPAATQPAKSSQPGAGPRLEVDHDEWNFGEVWQGEQLSHEFKLTNVGDAPLEFIRIRTSCGCTMPSQPRSPLGPGESDTMTVKYDSNRKARHARQTVTLETNDPSRPEVVLQVVGEVRPVFEIKPTDGLVFAQLLREAVEKRSVEITNLYTAKVALKLAEGQELKSCSVEVKELEPGMRYEVTATTKPPLAVGRVQQNVKFTTGLPRMPEINLNVYWYVQPPVEVSPLKLFLSKASSKEMVRQLRVTYTPDQPVEIAAVKPSHDSIAAEVQPAATDPLRPKLRQYKIMVTLPPAERLDDGVAPQIEIVTTSPEPEYQRFVVPIVLLTPGMRPQMAPVESQPATQPATPEPAAPGGG